MLSSDGVRAAIPIPIRIATAVVGIVALALLALCAQGARAATPTIENTGSQGGQTTWLTSFATSGEDNGAANTLRISMLVKHDVGKEVTGLRIDDNWDGTDNASSSTIHNVTAQQPTVTGGYGYSRIDFAYEFPTSNTGLSCGFLSGTRRTTDRQVRVRARLDDGTETATTASQVKFTAAGQCTGPEDFAFLYSWGGSNFNKTLTPGQSATFTYNGDDPDTTGSSDFQGVNWRIRNVRTGAISGETIDCDGNGDNAEKSTTVNFPNRGFWVVEAELRDGGGCTDNQNNDFWFPIGSANVNDSAAPSINLTATRPNYNGSTTVSAALGNDPDSPEGGRSELLEWDLDNNGSFETVNRGDAVSGLGTPQTQVINTTAQTPGLHTVRARVTDNGAMGGADNIRRTSAIDTVTYLVDNLPVANAQTVSTESSDSKAITLSGSDADSDALSYSIVDPPDHGLICTTADPLDPCSAGTGAARFYRPDGDFAGADTFTFRATDSVNGPSAPATVTVNVTPQTQITASPDAVSGSSTATFEFTSPVPGATFECRIDSALPTDFQACISPRQYAGLSDGPHSFQVRARTGAFVDPTPDSFGWTLDASLPETFIDSAPPNPTNSDSATFTFHSDDPGATFACRLDSVVEADFQPCATGATYPGLSEGPHIFEVRATDTFNRTDAIPASHTWQVDLTAPVVTIDSGPADPTNVADAEFHFSSTDLGASFACSIDGQPFAACISPKTYPGLDEGPHTFAVHATDAASNTGPDDTFDWEIDTGVPGTELLTGPPDESTSSVATFTFQSDDNTAGFQCRLDATDPWEECSSQQLYADLPDGPRLFEVRAVDAAGNVDASPALHPWVIDTTAPQTLIDSSPDNPTSETDAEFGFSSDDGGAAFECKLDAGDWESCTTTQSYPVLGPGQHTFRVRATDPFGNPDPTPAVRTWSIDTTAPTTTIDSGPPNRTAATSATIEFRADEAATFECRLNSSVEADFASCNPPANASGLSDGLQTFDVRATDSVGNPGAVATRTWTVDTTAPDVQISSAPPATTSATSASFSFTSPSDGTATFQCRLDNGAWQNCTTPKAYGGIDEGAHSFDVRARDSVGNTGAPATSSWTVANSGPPNTTITSAPADSTATSADFSFTSSEAATFECKLDAGAFAACGSGTPSTSGTKSYAGLAVGSHTFEVRAIDTDAPVKTDATPASHTWAVNETPATPPPGGGTLGVVAQSPVITPATRPLKRGKGTGATISCPTGPCTVTQKKAKVKIDGVTYRAVATVASSLAAGSTTVVKVALSKTGRTALAATGSGRLTLKLTVSSAGGSVTKKIKLKVKP